MNLNLTRINNSRIIEYNTHVYLKKCHLKEYHYPKRKRQFCIPNNSTEQTHGDTNWYYDECLHQQ